VLPYKMVVRKREAMMVGFDSKIPLFFSNYLIDRKTQYWWNNFTSSYFGINIGIGQGSVLSPILSTLYLFFLFYIFEKRAKNLKIPVLFLSFINNDLCTPQEKSFEKTNINLFYSYKFTLSYSNNLDLSLNMENLKFLIFPDHIASSIYSH